ANQGWKDSRDSIQFRDGTLASPPVALCEAQGYAVAAARRGAAILDAFGRAGADRWRAWAGALTDRFRARFWIREPADGGVPYPAIALDGRGRAVDTVTSNIGHLLGTGLLDDAETAAVVARLGSAELDSGHGLRTMGSSSAGFNPLSYHGGSVWAHDTAIVIAGLARVGTPDAHRVVASLARGLVDAAESFGYQTPELFSGETATSRSGAVPYPASCHPQAWSAAAAVVLVAAATGIRPDVPGGTIGVAPLRPSPFGAITVRGIRIGDADVHVEVGRDGTVDVGGALAGLRVVPG
ncbi:MAG: amylo-alpha-1,6-glucosidase, partial [Jatrophihabitantaceae bacterium]